MGRLRVDADGGGTPGGDEAGGDGDGLSDNGKDEDAHRRYAPSWCTSRLLRPILCLFIGCGRPPEMTERQWTVVSAVCAAGFFSHFDDDLLPLCLRQLQQSLDISEAQVGLMISLIGSGKAGAAIMSVLADVIGRRIVFFTSIVIFTLCSVCSAVQRSLWGFVVLQLVARIFLSGKDSMANVYLVEETDPASRGWVMGTYSSVAVTGGGFACILFGLVGGHENGWRYLYGLAALQLFFLMPLWTRLPEKTKSTMRRSSSSSGQHAHADADGGCKVCPEQGLEAGDGAEDGGVEDAPKRSRCLDRRRWTQAVRKGIRPLRLLFTSYPKRAAACLFVNFNHGFSVMPSTVLKVKHLQDRHGLTPGQVSIVALGSGLIALVMFPVLGRLSDMKGRRLLLCGFMSVCPVGVLLFYNAPGNLYLPFYVLQMMAGFALNVLQTTFFAEAFPASHRCTANGVMMLFAVLGAVVGLAFESLLYRHLGSHAASVSLIISPAFVSPFVVHCCLPETSGKDLDEIAPERDESFIEDDAEWEGELTASELLSSPKGGTKVLRSNSRSL